jgi:hypothetical protein
MGIKRKIEDISNFMSEKKYLDQKISDFGLLPNQIFKDSDPIFVLSTGRCGTKLLTKLFEISVNGEVHHEPSPRMIYSSRYVYENQNAGINVRKSAFLGGRYELLKDAYIKGNRYIETNNQITFFADAILDLMPKTKFIHLIRHPGDFVRSGIRRKYYNGHDYDDGRIRLGETQLWDSYSNIQKIGWLWNETNAMIENWKAEDFGNCVITVKSEDLFTDTSGFRSICEFLKIAAPSDRTIKKVIQKPVNVQRKGRFPSYIEWSEDDVSALKQIAPLGNSYGYFKE